MSVKYMVTFERVIKDKLPRKFSDEERLCFRFDFKGEGPFGYMDIIGLRSSRMKMEKVLETYFSVTSIPEIKVQQRLVYLRVSIICRDFRKGIAAIEENGLPVEEVSSLGKVFGFEQQFQQKTKSKFKKK